MDYYMIAFYGNYCLLYFLVSFRCFNYMICNYRIFSSSFFECKFVTIYKKDIFLYNTILYYFVWIVVFMMPYFSYKSSWNKSYLYPMEWKNFNLYYYWIK